MGRNKLKTLKLKKQSTRMLTYRRRNVSLFKKAIELGVICGGKVSLIICNDNSSNCVESTKNPITYFNDHKQFDSVAKLIRNYSGQITYIDNSNYNDVCSGIKPSILV